MLSSAPMPMMAMSAAPMEDLRYFCAEEEMCEDGDLALYEDFDFGSIQKKSAAPALMDLCSAPPPPMAPSFDMAGASSLSMPMSAPSVPMSTSSELTGDMLMVIVKCQSVTGAWKPEILARLNPITSKPETMDEGVWVTVVALAYL